MPAVLAAHLRARTSEGGPPASPPLELLVYTADPTLGAGPLGRCGICMQICGPGASEMAWHWPSSEGRGWFLLEICGPESVQVCGPDCKQHMNLATENLCVSSVPPPRLELATWKASGDSKGRKCPWSTATKAHGQYLCLSRGVEAAI